MAAGVVFDLKTVMENQLKILLFKKSSKENIEQIYHMIKLGADPLTTADDMPNYTILKHVISFDDLPTFQKFVEEFGYDLEGIDAKNDTPFDHALEVLSIDIIKWFLDSKRISVQKIQSSLTKFCANYFFDDRDIEKAIDIVKLLVKHGANLLQKTVKGKSIWEVSIADGFESSFTKFIKAETDILLSKAQAEEENQEKQEKEEKEEKSKKELIEWCQKLQAENNSLKEENNSLREENNSLHESMKNKNENINYLLGENAKISIEFCEKKSQLDKLKTSLELCCKIFDK